MIVVISSVLVSGGNITSVQETVEVIFVGNNFKIRTFDTFLTVSLLNIFKHNLRNVYDLSPYQISNI
jgi:hypothetical protein